MSAPVFPAGRIVGGRYAVHALLAQRPWTTTYSAIAAPNRELVIKVFAPEVATHAETTEMTRRVHAATNALGEPYVVTVLESGRDADSGCGFLVMAACAHPSLAQLVQLCPMTLREATTFARKVAKLLDLAHAAGVTHLALKPSNVFVGPAPDLAVRLADFGAGALRRAESPAERLAISGDWIAPEQATAPSEDRAGPPADRYALALLVFFALTGRTLPRAGSEPTAPRMAASGVAREAGVALSPDADAVFARALATDPAERFGTGADFVTAFAEATAADEAEALATAPRATDSASAAGPGAGSASATASRSAPAVEHVTSASAVAIPKPIASPAATVGRPAAPRAPPRARAPRTNTPLVAVLLATALGSLAGAVFLMMRALAKASPVGSVQAATTAAPPPFVASAPSSATPPAATSEAPAVASADRAPAADAATSATTASLVVVCEPACERVLVNGKPMPSYPEAATLPPGSYGVGVGRKGYGGQYQRVTLEPGREETVRFTLYPTKPP